MRKVLNKKAFTLTELIATIVILSILITLSVVVFVNIRRSALETEYSNLVSYLETKGIDEDKAREMIIMGFIDELSMQIVLILQQ